MDVFVEFTVGAADFAFGDALTAAPDVSQQALSDRVRRANEKILRRVLRPAAVDGRETGLAHSADRSDSA